MLPLDPAVGADPRVEVHATLGPAPGAEPDAVSAVLGEAGWEDLATATAPTTLVRGEGGYVTGADADEFTRRLPEASVITLPAGHNVQEDAPLELGAMLRGLVGDD